MKAKNESTTFFVDKTGDKIFVELKVTGNPDEAVHALMELMHTGKKIAPNLTVTQLFFKNRGLNDAIDQMKDKIKQAVNTAFDEVDKMFPRPVQDITSVTKL